ncbi:MAG: aquaporin family protein [Proteobacteria bacterium]|nr:aquaporin family protein [Pseudomonadota bacterium]MBI3499199.1 aquaporin family protein [Pseudomonadota bacterium]
MSELSLRIRVLAEGVGTAFLLAAIVGSGIMGERLAAGNAAVALLANTAATAAALFALIVCLGPVSGAHFNPAVTCFMAVRRELPWSEVPAYVLAQIVGALIGVAAAHLMFELPVFVPSTHDRGGLAMMGSEIVATVGLLAAICLSARYRPPSVPAVVACTIAAAYWFTASTSFANPAVTIGRSLTDTFSGIRPADAPGFIAAQILATLIVIFLSKRLSADAAASEPRGSMPQASRSPTSDGATIGSRPAQP